MFKKRAIDDLVRIAVAGGGFRPDASVKQSSDLVRIAEAASKSGAKVIFTGLATRTTDDLAQIGKAGKGCVFFDDEL
ncbi:MAG: hypothetical protein ABSH41_24160 [Syntrophobacteraceae bacterium]|jgi:DNA replication protein